ADARLEEAVRTLEREGDVRRIDHKITYNGAEGIPIREEVISQHQDVVISRNSYGALCLNTPDVFFADIDFAMESSFKAVSLAFVLLLGCAAVVSFFFQSSLVFILGAFLALILSSTLAAAIRNLMLRAKGGIEKIALDRINTVATENPELHVRVYRTPM